MNKLNLRALVDALKSFNDFRKNSSYNTGLSYARQLMVITKLLDVLRKPRLHLSLSISTSTSYLFTLHPSPSSTSSLWQHVDSTTNNLSPVRTHFYSCAFALVWKQNSGTYALLLFIVLRLYK